MKVVEVLKDNGRGGGTVGGTAEVRFLHRLHVRAHFPGRLRDGAQHDHDGVGALHLLQHARHEVDLVCVRSSKEVRLDACVPQDVFAFLLRPGFP